MTPLNLLTEINLDDLVSAFGWTNRPLLARTLRRVFLHPARTFAEQMVAYDNAVGERGLPEGSRVLLRQYVRSLQVYGREHIPTSSALFLSNHPGMADTLALFSALNRP